MEHAHSYSAKGVLAALGKSLLYLLFFIMAQLLTGIAYTAAVAVRTALVHREMDVAEAAQLAAEFREFFPENAVEYFISYYDYYQPEAYIAQTDTYIEKDSSINDEIERLRHSATSALSERRDVIVVSSVSCIYGLGDPIDYKNMVILSLIHI